MSLYSRLHESSAEDGAATGASKRDPALDDLRQRVHQHLIEDLGPLLYDKRLSEDELRAQVREQVQAAIAQETTPLSAADRVELVQGVTDDIVGYGPLEKYLHDDEISEVMVNGPYSIYVERRGRIERVPASFVDEHHLRRIIDKIVGQVGRRIDEAQPLCDARLPDGSRINAVIHPLAIGGPFLTIRKFSKDPLQVSDLISFGTLDERSAKLLEACVAGKLNIIVSGGTGTGKTTMLNVLSSFIPSDERIVTVEDAKELQLHQDHVLSMEARPSNIEGRGEVTIRDLVRNALRMRPDRIIVGECRSGEALDMLQAMNTGHDGSLTTMHANSPRDALSRIETMTLMAGFDLPIRAIREQMASAVDCIIQLSRMRDGTRRVTHITEVQGMEGDVVTVQDVFLFDMGMGFDAEGRTLGHLKSTGIRPQFTEKLADAGILLGPEVFAPEPFMGRSVGGRR